MRQIMSGRGFIDYSENGEHTDRYTDRYTHRHTGVSIKSVPD